MRTSLHDAWGSARGPVTRLAPWARLLTGAVLFAVCLTAPAWTPSGLLVIATAVICWVVLCRPPWRIVLSVAALGIVLLGPYFLLMPLIHADQADSGGGWRRAFIAPWGVFLRGLSVMLVSTATVTSLGPGDLHQALASLPLPGVVTAVLTQIVRQTGTLVQESRRITAAMALRGASGAGLAAWRVLAALPVVWLPRVARRAERVAAAMELRGYTGELGVAGHRRAGIADVLALALGLAWLGVAAGARLWGQG